MEKTKGPSDAASA